MATMLRIRHLEETVSRLKRADQVHGLIHLSIGQEATAAGICLQLRDSDAAYSGHRPHGHAVAKGAPLVGVLAELMGRSTGLCRGLGGSMHLVDAEHGFLGATGVVGGNVAMAVGSALASRLDGRTDVAVVYFGDGAVQSGLFAETVNLATLWQLPVIFVCENNGYAEFTPRSAHTSIERVTDVVAPFPITCATVDGSDVVAVYTTFGGFLAAAREGRGPFLLEALTHRLRGHYEGDPDAYREAVSAEEWLRMDPVARTRRHGIDAGWFTEQEYADLDTAAAAAVAAAVAEAQEGGVLSEAEMSELVLARPA